MVKPGCIPHEKFMSLSEGCGKRDEFLPPRYSTIISGGNCNRNTGTGGYGMKNIVLIGMPGAGKSTVGVLLAKTLGRRFIDTDLLIQESTGRLLQEIIDADGPDAFLAVEEQIVLGLHRHRAVIATGGSVVYSSRAMEHLRNHGVVVYLKISFEEMEQRLSNISTRGVVVHPGEDLRSLYDRRKDLYGKYADLTIDCSQAHFEDCIRNLVEDLEPYRT